MASSANEKVFKYDIEVPDGGGRVHLRLPKRSRFISLANQKEKLVMWRAVDERQPLEDVFVRIVLTGREIGVGELQRAFLGTVQFDGGDFVVHVYQEVKRDV